MKKIVLLVASILATLHSIASRNSNDSNYPLTLSPSDGIYNHGSHASHTSHASHWSHISHYSMTITVKKDSIQNVNQKDRNSIIHSLALMHECADKNIEIIGLYISKNNGITCEKRDEVRYNPAPSEKCLYVSFRTYIYRNVYEYIIPLSSSVNNYYRILDGRYYTAGKKEEWMVDFANKNK